MGRALVAIGLAICMALAACGGSDEAELSKAAFVKKANAICVSAYKEAQEKGGNNLVAKAAGILDSEAEEIGNLNGPSNDAAQIEAIVDGTREAADKFEKEQKSALAGMVKLEKLQDAYGIESCPVP
jgi:hypothetical protein